MQRPEVPVHYLTENKREWSPGAVIFFDTESRRVVHPGGETHRLRLWTARAVDRRPVRGKAQRNVAEQGFTPGDLADAVCDLTKGRKSVWLFAHNLSFDLSVSMLPKMLVDRGWTITAQTLGGKSPWLRLNRKGTTLAICDTWSWLPVSVAELGQAVGIPKPPLPTDDDTDEAWFTRCQADTDIIARAMCDLMDWWDAKRLGNWTTTGPATGWNAYRHNAETRQVVIHPDPEIVAEDRAYVHGGRRVTWSLGDHRAGPYLELDIERAYPTVAAHFPLPHQHGARFESLPLDHVNLDHPRWSVVARCLIRTRTPSVPVRWQGKIYYPVGEFWANLAGPDIVEARRNGQLLRIGPGRTHQLSYSMRPWAAWALDTISGRWKRDPAVARIAVKHWSRTTIGKWAAHGYTAEPWGQAPDSGWGFEDAWDHNSQCHAAVQDVAGQRWFVAANGDPENAYPVIFAWVESHVRVALNRAVDMIGDGALLSGNTDGLIASQSIMGTAAAGGSVLAPVGLAGRARADYVIAAVNAAIAPFTLRVKTSAGRVTVTGPQHVRFGDRLSMSGVPAKADEIAPNTFQFTTWPKLSSQLARGMDGTYERTVRTVRMATTHPSGWVLTDGRVVAAEMTTDAAGNNVMLPWLETRWSALGLVPADEQRPDLAKLLPPVQIHKISTQVRKSA